MREQRGPRRGVLAALALVVFVLAVGVAAWWLDAPHDAVPVVAASAAVVRHVPSFELAAEVTRLAAETREAEALAAPAALAEPVGAGFDIDVVDSEGQPVRGARVSLSDAARLSGVTDASGRVHLPGDPFARAGGNVVDVTVSALCYRVTRQPLPRPPAGDSLIVAGPPPAPPRLVLRRRAVLQVVLESPGPRDVEDLFIVLRGTGPLYEAGPPPSDSGAIGGRQTHTYTGRPEVEGSLFEVGQRFRKEGEIEERLYDFSDGGTRLLVGLQPERPIEVLIAGRYGERLAEQCITLAPEEWRTLELRVDVARRDLSVSIQAPDATVLKSGRIVLEVERPLFDTSAAIQTLSGWNHGLEFKDLRADAVDVRVTSPYFIPRSMHVALEPGVNRLVVELQPAGPRAEGR